MLPDIKVSGVGNPDVTGSYNRGGIHNGSTYYVRKDGAFHIWWDGIVLYHITPGLGDAQPPSFFKANQPVEGDYASALPYTGAVTVTRFF